MRRRQCSKRADHLLDVSAILEFQLMVSSSQFLGQTFQHCVTRLASSISEYAVDTIED
jgi:hypothetical protein